METYLAKIGDGKALSAGEASAAMHAIMSGDVSPVRIAAFLTALRVRGVTAEELTGFARTMREHSIRITPAVDGLVDTCGTGGGGLPTFNISTTAAFVVAGAGVPVAKHGNRAMTSTCGSADCLEALGVGIACAPEQVRDCIERIGIGFLFAQAHHPAMKHAGPVRRELPYRTVFNLLGPLTNPAGASAQVIGVYEPSLTELLAETLCRLGTQRAFVVHGMDGLDEFSTLGLTRVSEVRDGKVETYEIAPEDLGLTRAPAEALRPGDGPEGSAQLTRMLLKGERGPRRDIVLLNAAAALTAAGAAADLKDGLARAAESLDSGAALRKLDRLVEATYEG